MTLIEDLKAIVGENAYRTDPDDLLPHVTEWRGVVHGQTPILLLPADTSEVVRIVRCCAAAGTAIVPQGGNTGMCAGAVPDESGTQVVLSLARMNAIRSVDRDNYSMIVEAGCILQNIQDAARKAGRHFPLSLGAEGSCQIGGNLSTNAGGINVIRYGTARSQLLGLEVVLADGTIVNSLRALRKDTAGYDLKQLFVGSEGTLGIITAAALKLYPDPGETRTMLVSLPSSGDAVKLLGLMRDSLGDKIEAFELVSDFVFSLVEKHVANTRLPFRQRSPWYVLTDVTPGSSTDALETTLQRAVDARVINDAIVAKNETESAAMWRLRHSITEGEKAEGKALKHDISVPLSAMQEFLLRGEALIESLAPGSQLVAFGHVGDGNLHYNVMLPHSFKDGEAVTAGIYTLATELGGSFSAEHGVGRLKSKYLPQYRTESEVALMKTLKKALDPANILNPGKVI
ncbi:MAG: FAD-binding oxidoreductase [Gammaproteobacteria bacterium]|nr:FAD-binding oxidoreductase [Gammaproteobacteria bacterium]